jgi:hypothetical protein
MDADTFVANYGAAVEARRATVLVGAGFSIGAGYPSWETLLDPLRTALDVPAGVVDLTMIAQYVENKADGRKLLVEAICESIGAVNPLPKENHRLLEQMPLDEIWTTNYDSLVEMAIPGAVVVELDHQFIDSSASTRRIYKMHGSIGFGGRTPSGGIENLVISQSDFDLYERRHPRFSRLLQAQILTKSFLFLGFSFADPNFDAALKLVRLSTPDRLMDHFAIIRREAGDGTVFDLRAEDLLRSGVHVIEVANYEQVTDLLRRIVARTRPSRLLISGSQPRSGHQVEEMDPGSKYPKAAVIESNLTEIAEALGGKLADAGINVTTASPLGASVGYALVERLGDQYDPDRMMLVRRHKNEDVDPPNRRCGGITFIGDDPATLRNSVFDQVRAVIVLGGGEGTFDEVSRANERKMGVVPLACTGGTALAVWETMRGALREIQLGGKQVDLHTFDSLNSTDPIIAVDAAMILVRQAMYLPVVADIMSDQE